MTGIPQHIAFHVGAHKTATTHLQKCIKRAHEPLAAVGVRFCGPENFRLPGRTIQALFGFRESRAAEGPKRPPQEQLALLAKGADRLVLSEENFIGPLNSPKGVAMRQRYRPAGARLAQFAEKIGQPGDVFLAVRRPTAFLNSAYCQMLLGGQIRPPGIYLRRNPISSVDWADLVTRIRQAPGVGRLVVWRHEDYQPLFRTILTEMLGAEGAAIVPQLDRTFNAGLSATAVAEVLHRQAHEPIPNIANVARSLLPVGDGYPPFDAFDPEAHQAGDRAYHAQIAAIAGMDGVTLLRP